MTTILEPPSPAPLPEPALRRAGGGALAAGGEPMMFLTAGATAIAVFMIVGLLALILFNGMTTFWPHALAQLTTRDGKIFLGEPTRHERFSPQAGGPPIDRTLYHTGNFDLTGTDFTWISDPDVTANAAPPWAMVIERTEWGNAYGTLEKVIVDGQSFDGPQAAWDEFRNIHPTMRALGAQIAANGDAIEALGRQRDDIRTQLNAAALKFGTDSPQYQNSLAALQPQIAALEAQMAELTKKTDEIQPRIATARIIIRTTDGKIIPANRAKPDEPMLVAQVVRIYPANQLGFFGKLGVYFSRWREFLFDNPREANTEGGVWPAIVGTVLMTFIMIVLVVPMGVIAAIYLREYARQGWIVALVRITVNNLAGVPSVVFGLFGVGFFCYLLGGSIDRVFFADHLPNPTVGKTALIWASLTLALLTLPVVIVATEEAIAAVPRSLRESSYGCGATKWQTIWRVVLPRSMPGIMTGMILAIARGTGEVAPLMLVGAVGYAPDLPISTQPPFFGINRSFMHLGFHIYDVGFLSRNSEAALPMVYTTTLLLIAIVVGLNLFAMWLRNRLRRSYLDGQF